MHKIHKKSMVPPKPHPNISFSSINQKHLMRKHQRMDVVSEGFDNPSKQPTSQGFHPTCITLVSRHLILDISPLESPNPVDQLYHRPKQAEITVTSPNSI